MTFELRLDREHRPCGHLGQVSRQTEQQRPQGGQMYMEGIATKPGWLEWNHLGERQWEEKWGSTKKGLAAS